MRFPAALASTAWLLLLQTMSVWAEENPYPYLSPQHPCEKVARYDFWDGDAAHTVPFTSLDGKAAETACAGSLATDPTTPRLKLLLARAKMKLEKWQEATDLLNELVAAEYAPAKLLLAVVLDSTQESVKQMESRALLKETADDGLPLAQLSYAEQLLLEPVAGKNHAMAAQLLENAGRHGFAMADYYLGWILLNGDETLRDPQRGLDLYRRSEARGNREAAYQLGIELWYGDNIIEDRKAALRYFDSAYRRGGVFAATYLALGLREYGTTAAEKDRAIDLAREAADAGDTYAMALLGEWLLAIGTDLDGAEKWLRQAAQAEELGAMRELGIFLLGDTERAGEGRDWLAKAAAAGSGIAASRLGDAWATGIGGGKDASEAASWFRKAAEQGYSYGMFQWAEVLAEGNGIAIDRNAAKDWYVKALEGGYDFAGIALANRILAGQVPGIQVEALGYLTAAAEKDDPYALNRLGEIFLGGSLGERNLEKAETYLTRAAALDYPYADLTLAEIKMLGLDGTARFTVANDHLARALAGFTDGSYQDREMMIVTRQQQIWLLTATGRFAEAEEIALDLLAIRQESDAPDLEMELRAALVGIYVNQGRAEEARAIALEQLKRLPEGTAERAWLRSTFLTHLGEAEVLLEDIDAAQQSYRAAIEAWESSGMSKSESAYDVEKLGETYLLQAEPALAIATFEHAIALRAELHGPDSPLNIRATAGLAQAYAISGKLTKADDLFKGAVAKLADLDLPMSPEIARGMMNYAEVRIAMEDPQGAGTIISSIVDDYLARENELSRALSPGSVTERRVLRSTFVNGIDLLASMQKKAGMQSDDLAFTLGQLAMGQSASTGIEAMLHRSAAGDGEGAASLRSYQDAVMTYRSLVQQLSRPDQPQVGDTPADDTILLSAIADVRRTLRQQKPGIADRLVDQAIAPTHLAEVQAALQKGEALVMYIFGDDGGFAWVVTSGSTRLIPLSINRQQLRDVVRGLRQYLDPIVLQPGAMKFPLQQAGALYDAIFRPFANELAGITRLTIVPDETLQSLPLGVLVDNHGAEVGLAAAPWLTRRFAISYMPSARSFVGLRQMQIGDRLDSLIGFGDPVMPPKVELPMLPETRDELDSLQSIFGQANSGIFIGERATETTVKKVDLAAADVIAFATHGLLANETNFNDEPALVLGNSADDDGLLTASEVANLELSADLVILSACNTAAALNDINREALSGLARGFFFAGARNLLVSHWAVVSSAATETTTNLLRAMQNGAGSMAVALQSAQLEMIKDERNNMAAHPAYWAPFVLVGTN